MIVSLRGGLVCCSGLVLSFYWCAVWVGGFDRERCRWWRHVVGPCFCCGVVSESVVWEVLVIVVAAVEEGGAVAVPAAVGCVFAGDTPLGVCGGAFTGAVVLATGATDV